MAEYDGPVYLHIGRAETPLMFNDDHKMKIGKGIIVREGNDITLISNGVMVFRCLEAAKILAKEGINTRVINMHTVKPFDVSIVKQAADETGTIVTVEHSIIGGLGGAVAEVLSECCPAPIERIGIVDTFVETALNPESLLDYYRMKVNDIVQATYRALKRKKKVKKLKAVVKFRKGEGNIKVQHVSEPKVGPDEVKIEFKAAGICGTDIDIYHKKSLKVTPSDFGA